MDFEKNQISPNIKKSTKKKTIKNIFNKIKSMMGFKDDQNSPNLGTSPNLKTNFSEPINLAK